MARGVLRRLLPRAGSSGSSRSLTLRDARDAVSQVSQKAAALPAHLPPLRSSDQPLVMDGAERVRIARGMNRGAGVLAGSVLADSAIEHYRGGFHNPAMFFPLISSTLSIIASAHGVSDLN